MAGASWDRGCATVQNRFKVHSPHGEVVSSARWLINGFPATILVWTEEEWARLTERPEDAQPYPNGIWCALRIE